MKLGVLLLNSTQLFVNNSLVLFHKQFIFAFWTPYLKPFENETHRQSEIQTFVFDYELSFAYFESKC